MWRVILDIFFFGLGAFWMMRRADKYYCSEIWKAQRDVKIAKLKAEQETYLVQQDRMLLERNKMMEDS